MARLRTPSPSRPAAARRGASLVPSTRACSAGSRKWLVIGGIVYARARTSPHVRQAPRDRADREARARSASGLEAIPAPTRRQRHARATLTVQGPPRPRPRERRASAVDRHQAAALPHRAAGGASSTATPGSCPTTTSSASLRARWVVSTKGAKYPRCGRRSRTSWSRCRRGAQVIYPKDLAPICMLADIGPGVRVFETGVGSARCRSRCCEWGATIVGYELRDDFANRARTNVRGFLGPTRPRARYEVEARQLRGHRRRRTAPSTASCSTCPNRGRWCRTPTCPASRWHPRGLHAVDHAGRQRSARRSRRQSWSAPAP